MNIVKRYEEGAKFVAITRSFGMSHATVTAIVYDRNRIMAHMKDDICKGESHHH